jgi:hypothetical protein
MHAQGSEIKKGRKEFGVLDVVRKTTIKEYKNK